MSALSAELVKRLGQAVTDRDLGSELASALQNAKGSSHQLVGAIVATSTSQTTDFGDLLAGDVVLVLPVAAGNSKFVAVAADGDLGTAAVIGSLYVVLRGVPAAASIVW